MYFIDDGHHKAFADYVLRLPPALTHDPYWFTAGYLVSAAGLWPKVARCFDFARMTFSPDAYPTGQLSSQEQVMLGLASALFSGNDFNLGELLRLGPNFHGAALQAMAVLWDGVNGEQRHLAWNNLSAGPWPWPGAAR